MQASNKKAADKASQARTVAIDAGAPLNPDAVVVHRSNRGTVGTGPSSYKSISEAELRRAKVKQIAAQNDYIGQVHAEPADFDLIEKRLREVEASDYDEWVARHIDWTNPATIAVWRQCAPDFFERRMQYVSEVVDQQTKLAAIQARGYPATPDESFFLYMVDTGQVKLHDKPAHIMVNMAPTTDSTKANIKQGWLSKLFSGSGPVNNAQEVQRRLRNPYADTTTARLATTMSDISGTTADLVP